MPPPHERTVSPSVTGGGGSAIPSPTASYRAQLHGALDQYQTAVANAQNEIMKVLTMVLLPITVVAGIYGMNFGSMPELRVRWGYPAVWVLIVAGMLTAFRWRGWLGGCDDPGP